MRGQASVETLMTYGWMLLIAVTIIWLLYKFGIVSALARLVQGGEGVAGFGSFSASARVVPGGNVSFKLANIGGGNAAVQYISVGGEMIASPSPPFPFNVSRGMSIAVNGLTTKINGSVGDGFGPVTVQIGFDTASHAGHKDSAVMYGSIQPG